MEIKTKYNIGDVVKIKDGRYKDKSLIIDQISCLSKETDEKIETYIYYRVKCEFWIPLYFEEEELI